MLRKHVVLQRLPSYLNHLNPNHSVKPFGSIAHMDRIINHSVLSDRDLSYFDSVIDNSAGNAILSSSSTDLSSYNIELCKKHIGKSQLVLKPKTAEEVSAILSYCNQHKLAIHTQGGNTSLVGGGVAVFDEIILNTSRMNNILSFDDMSGILICESGCILQDVDNYVRLNNGNGKHKIPHIFPLDLGAKGTCQIGGNISTNAGGLRLVRFGSLHGSVLGLQVVTANGNILDLLSQCRKDNTGYDLKQLFIGSEGQLGVITKACILCPKWCCSTNLMFVSVKNFENVLKINKLAQTDLNEILSAIEFLDDCSIDQPIKYLNIKYPLKERDNFYVLIETQGSNFDHDREKLDTFIEKLIDLNLINNGCIAEDINQFKLIWQLRENIGIGGYQYGKCIYKYDLSLPLNTLYDVVNECKYRLTMNGYYDVEIMGYGHLGDGNIHVSISVDDFNDKLESCIEPWIFQYVSSFKGSISAEHGIGIMKPQFLHLSKDKQSIQYMKQIKNVFDPNNILNPYLVLP